LSFPDVELLAGGVHKAELALRVFPVQLAIPPVRGCSVGTDLDHGHLVEFAAIFLGVSFQRVDDEPLIGVLLANLSPTHINLLSYS
jgi:hypothetical protein